MLLICGAGSSKFAAPGGISFSHQFVLTSRQRAFLPVFKAEPKGALIFICHQRTISRVVCHIGRGIQSQISVVIFNFHPRDGGIT